MTKIEFVVFTVLKNKHFQHSELIAPFYLQKELILNFQFYISSDI